MLPLASAAAVSAAISLQLALILALFFVLLLLPTPTIPPVLHCAARYSRLCCNFTLRGPIIRAVLQLTHRRGCCRGGKRGGRPRAKADTTASAPEASTNVGQLGVARALCASYANRVAVQDVHCYATLFNESLLGVTEIGTASAPEASTNVGQLGVARALCASYASSCRFRTPVRPRLSQSGKIHLLFWR